MKVIGFKDFRPKDRGSRYDISFKVEEVEEVERLKVIGFKDFRPKDRGSRYDIH